jgi:hypothetical protein
MDRIKQVVLELLRSGEDPHEVLTSLSRAYKQVDTARDYIPLEEDYLDYYKAIKDADFRP